MTGKMVRSALLYIFFLNCFTGGAFCAEIEVKSEVNPTKASIDDFIRIKVSISGPDARQAEMPVLDRIPDFTVLSEISTGSSTVINNFQISVTKSYTFTVKPRKIGTFSVGAVSVKAGKQTFRAPATKVEIVAGTVPKTQPSTPPSQRRIDSSPGRRNGSDDAFIKVYVDNQEPYVGEQITLTFEFYYNLAILSDTEYSPSSTTGFWSIDLPKIRPTTKVLGNRIFNVNTIKTALSPTTSGNLTIGEATVRYRSGGFFSPTRSRTIFSEPITVQVKPFPKKGKPADFSGAVGDFSISASADKKSASVGDVITVKIAVAGKGNLDLVTSLNAPNFSAFKTYDPKVSETISNSGFVVGGAKTWEYVISPRYQGDITLDSFSLSYFNPEDESYHTISTEPIDLNILPGDVSAFSGTTRDISRKAIENIANDIHFIKPDKTILKSTRRQVYSNIAFYLVYLLPFSAFTTAFAVKRRRDAFERNTGLKRRLNAWKNAQKRLDKAKRLLDKEKIRDFCGKLSETAIEYIGDRLNLDTSTLTTTGVENILKENGISPQLAERVRKTLELCDFVRFSPDVTGHKIRENLLNDTRDIIAELKEVL